MKRLLSQVVAATGGLWLATLLMPEDVAVTAYPTSNFFGLALTAQWHIFLFLGIILGLLNYFVKPLLKTLTLPLEVITLGFFSLAINMFFIWLMDLIFDELSISQLLPLLYTTVIIWAINLILQFLLLKNKS